MSMLAQSQTTQRGDPMLVIDRADIATSTKAQYKRALKRFFRETGAAITNAEALTIHADQCPTMLPDVGNSRSQV